MGRTKIIHKKVEGIGYIYEVDLECPQELHDLHNDYPLAPQKMTVNDDMLSTYCKMIKNKFGISNGNVQKLIPTLYNKEKYVLHEKNFGTLFKSWSTFNKNTSSATI